MLYSNNFNFRKYQRISKIILIVSRGRIKVERAPLQWRELEEEFQRTPTLMWRGDKDEQAAWISNITKKMLLSHYCHVIFYLTLERLGWLWIWDGDLEAWTNWEEVPGFSSYHCDCRDTQIHLNWLAKWRFWPVYASLIGLRAAMDSQGLAGGERWEND